MPRSMAQGYKVTGVSSIRGRQKKRPAAAKRKVRPKSAAQHQAAREISGASKKIAQLHGTTGRADVAAGRAGMVAERIRNTQAVIAQREGQQRIQNFLAVGAHNRANRRLAADIRASRARSGPSGPRNVFRVPQGGAVGSSVLTQRRAGQGVRARRPAPKKKPRRPARRPAAKAAVKFGDSYFSGLSRRNNNQYFG